MTFQTLETVDNRTDTDWRTEASATFNIASYLPQMAAARPDQRAVVLARSGAALTFAELEALSNRYANGLVRTGVVRGQRVLVMVRPGFEFLGLIFALFKMGAVPVMIDPGMGVGRMLECISTVDLHGFVGVPLAHMVRVFRRSAFRGIHSAVTVGRRWFWGGTTLHRIASGASNRFTPVDTKTSDAAAILFTSGSTGPAKGVVYEHGMFDAQVRMIQSHYCIEPGEIDLPTFPLFGLFSVAMGMTAIIPDMDAARPARVDPAKIVDAIREHGVTNTFGSPAVWRRVAPYCVKRGIRLPTLRRILIAGAPVAWQVIEQLHGVLAESADVHTPYGATESMPVSSISGREVLKECREASRAGAGTCVGRPLPGVEVRLIRITDDSIPQWTEGLVVAEDQPGEIVVAGPVVTRAYFALPQADALSKIRDGDRLWHRIGDIGRRDAEGRLWFCGRKSQRVASARSTLFTDCIEGIINEHPEVARSALVGIGPLGNQKPVLIVEPRPGRFPRAPRVPTLTRELLALLDPFCNRQSTIDNRQSIEHVLFHRSLPVDVRHNAKINREALAEWAEKKCS